MRQTIAKIIVTLVTLAAIGFLMWCVGNLFYIIGWPALAIIVGPIVMVSFIWALGELS